jgi:hypothetical protein
MPKKQRIKLLEVVPKQALGSLSAVSINLTTDNKPNYEIVTSKFMPFPKEDLKKVKYGTGPISYEGMGDTEGTMLYATSSDGKNYLVRAVGSSAVSKLSKVIANESSKLGEMKISSSQAVGGISVPVGVNIGDLIDDAVVSQQNLSNKRTQVSVSSDGVFMVGTKASSKSFEIGPAKDDSAQATPCLSILSVIKEAKGKFISQMDELNLELTDVHILSLRDAMLALNDCKLKEIILKSIKEEYSLPAKDKMKKVKDNPLASKVKFAETGLKSAVRYLDDPEFTVQAQGVVETFLTTLAYKGWINKITFYSGAKRKPTSSLSKEDIDKVWKDFVPENALLKEPLMQNPEVKAKEEGGANV